MASWVGVPYHFVPWEKPERKHFSGGLFSLVSSTHAGCGCQHGIQGCAWYCERRGLPEHRRHARPAAEMGGEEEGRRGDGRQEGGVAQAAGEPHSEMGHPQASCGLIVWTPAFCRFPSVSRESSGWDCELD